MDTLRPGTHMTKAIFPVAVPMIVLSSITLALTGNIDPSDAQVFPSVAFDGVNWQTFAMVWIKFSVCNCCIGFGMARYNAPDTRLSICRCSSRSWETSFQFLCAAWDHNLLNNWALAFKVILPSSLNVHDPKSLIETMFLRVMVHRVVPLILRFAFWAKIL